MAIDYGWQNRTVLGYHSKDSDTYGVIQDKFPVLTKELEAMFLVTRNHYFTISTPQISNVITNFLRYQKFEDRKRSIANVFVIPGLVVALGYILRLFDLFANIQIIESFLASPIANLLFGLSILSVIILWHDYYKDKSHPIKLPRTEMIPQREMEEIKQLGFKFNNYSHLDTIKYINDQTLNIVCENIEKNKFSVFTTFITLLQVNSIQEILKRANIKIDIDDLEKHRINEETLPTYPATTLRSILIYALEEALLTESSVVRPENLFIALFKVFPVLQKFLQESNSSIDILREIVRYNSRLRKKTKSTNVFNPNVAYYRKGGIAESWIYQYTYILSNFSKDINNEVAKTRDVFAIGHEEELESLISTLAKSNNKNVLLIGEAGTGKSNLILGVAQRINQANVPIQLRNKRIIELDIDALIGFSQQDKENVEKQIVKSMEELSQSKDVILFIDNIEELVPVKGESSGHDLAEIMIPYILDDTFPIVGTVNNSDYKKYFYSQEQIRQSFVNIEIDEVSLDDALYILETKIDMLEEKFNCYITFPALITAVELAQRYIKEYKLPRSSVQTIQTACAWAQENNVSILSSDNVAKAITVTEKTNVEPVSTEETTRFMQLEENISRQVVGQDEAISAIIDGLRNTKSDSKISSSPLAKYLFTGSTGSGKTYLSEILCREFFGEDGKVIKVDMSKYQDAESTELLLKDDDTEEKTFLNRVQNNPSTVILFDNIEKAHPDVLDLLIKIFDEGKLTTTIGETIDFTNTIVICTSNIGSPILLDTLKQQNPVWEEAKSRVLIELNHSFRSELLSQFDKVVVFQPHNTEDLTEITELLLNQMANTFTKEGFIIKWNTQIPMLIANKAKVPGMGARPIKKYIQDNIEGKIAQQILQEEVKSGDEITIRESWIM